MVRKRKLILLASMSLIASTMALGGFSVAWYSAQRQQSVTFSAIEVMTPQTNITDFKCYGVTQITKDLTTTSITFVNQERFEMPLYDPQGINYSSFMRAIVIHVTFEYNGDETISMSAITTPATR